MRKLLLLPLFFGLVSPAIAHNEANGGCGNHCVAELGSKFNPGVNSKSTNKPKKIIIEEISQPSSIDNQPSSIDNQPSSIDNQRDDANSNVKRTGDTTNYMAIYIVIGILVTIIPLVTWRYFTK